MISAPRMSERQFTDAVIGAAKRLGWLVHHDAQSAQVQQVRTARGLKWVRRKANAEPGFPDLVLLHPERRRLIFAELKRDLGPRGGGADVMPSPEQAMWLAGLGGVASGPVTVALWRPVDLDAIYATLGETA